MRGVRPLHVFGLLMTAGCSTFQGFPDRRPPTLPSPIDVQQEIRDARYFLALPDESFLPAAAFRPGIGSRATSPH
jgi:hypothetical protein